MSKSSNATAGTILSSSSLSPAQSLSPVESKTNIKAKNSTTYSRKQSWTLPFPNSVLLFVIVIGLGYTISMHHHLAYRRQEEQEVFSRDLTKRTNEVLQKQVKIIKNDLLTTRNNTDVKKVRPPLESLFDENGNVIGDVNFLLDFAILGMAKCGTSTMMHWLANHSQEIQCFRNEVRELRNKNVPKFIEMFYKELPSGSQYKRGYKNAADIQKPYVHDIFRTIFPKTNIIIGIRHPIRWFESLYNFRVQNLGTDTSQWKMPPTYQLVRGKCPSCASRSNFAESLIRLGKQYLITNDNQQEQEQHSANHSNRRQPTELEYTIVGGIRNNISSLEPIPNPIFLYEMEQLKDENVTRSKQFRVDVQNFLNLKYPLSPLIHVIPGKQPSVHNVTTNSSSKEEDINQKKINICDKEHNKIRNELMKYAKQNSIWIREIFINCPTVYVSSKEYLISLLENWMIDPCSQTTTK